MNKTCPQCGYATDTLCEGYCLECCQQNQGQLLSWNFSYVWWQDLSDQDRDLLIRQACL